MSGRCSKPFILSPITDSSVSLFYYFPHGQCGMQQNTYGALPSPRSLGLAVLLAKTCVIDDRDGNSSSKGLSVNRIANEGPRLLPKPEVHRLLHPRVEAAWLLGISVRSLDYLIANKLLATRKVGGRVLIPHGELIRFSRADHFECISKAA